MTTQYLSITEVSERLGVTRASIHRRADVPEPDAVIGTVRGWKAETVDEWWANANHSPGRLPREVEEARRNKTR